MTIRGTILARLKDATAERHEALEHALPLMDNDLTVDAYRALLAAFLGYYRPMEARLARVSSLDQWLPDARERSKRLLLERDLAALGMDDATRAALPDCVALPTIDDDARALGALYVLEGSTLGGQLITRRLAQTLTLTPARGAAFFAGYGADTGARWRRYGEAVQRFADASDHATREAIVRAAVETFETMRAWLGDRGHPTR